MNEQQAFPVYEVTVETKNKGIQTRAIPTGDTEASEDGAHEALRKAIGFLGLSRDEVTGHSETFIPQLGSDKF
jgi:hypothetical protein